MPKKKNLKNVRILDSTAITNEDRLMAAVYHADRKDQYHIPAPYRAACHQCKPVKHFMSIKQLQEHDLSTHRVWKG